MASADLAAAAAAADADAGAGASLAFLPTTPLAWYHHALCQLGHATVCAAADCHHLPHGVCAATKTYLQHLPTCRGPDSCEYSNCAEFRRALHHFYRCGSSTCLVCFASSLTKSHVPQHAEIRDAMRRYVSATHDMHRVVAHERTVHRTIVEAKHARVRVATDASVHEAKKQLDLRAVEPHRFTLPSARLFYSESAFETEVMEANVDLAHKLVISLSKELVAVQLLMRRAYEAEKTAHEEAMRVCGGSEPECRLQLKVFLHNQAMKQT